MIDALEQIFTLFTIAGIFSLSLTIYLLVKKKHAHKKWRLLALLPILMTSLSIWSDVYPSDDFYKAGFEDAIGLEFPAEAEFVEKPMIYSNEVFNGHYAVSFIEMDEDSYYSLQTRFWGGNVDNYEVANYAEELKGMFKELIGERYFVDEYFVKLQKGNYFYIAFLSDKKTIIIRKDKNWWGAAIVI